jgi:hypothetical protein
MSERERGNMTDDEYQWYEARKLTAHVISDQPDPLTIQQIEDMDSEKLARWAHAGERFMDMHDKPSMHDPHSRVTYPAPYPRSYQIPPDGVTLGDPELEQFRRVIESIDETNMLLRMFIDRVETLISDERHTHTLLARIEGLGKLLDLNGDRAAFTNELLAQIAGLLQAQAARDPMAIMEQILEGSGAEFDTTGGPPGS